MIWWQKLETVYVQFMNRVLREQSDVMCAMFSIILWRTHYFHEPQTEQRSHFQVLPDALF